MTSRSLGMEFPLALPNKPPRKLVPVALPCLFGLGALVSQTPGLRVFWRVQVSGNQGIDAEVYSLNK